MTKITAASGHSHRPRIVAAARMHFFTHGFRGVSMDDLAAELGMSKKTLYAHFASKSDLLHAVLQNKFAGIEAEMKRITASAKRDFLPMLHDLLACVQRETEEIRPPFLRDIRRESPDVFQFVESRRAEILQKHFGRIFARGRRAGMVRKDVPVALAVDVLLAATHAIMNPAKLRELNLMPKKGFTAIISVVLNGVLTRKAR